MPSDLSITAVSPVAGSSENPTEPKPGFFIPPVSASPPQTGPPIVNPTLRFDGALGLVVIEFHDKGGQITSSIPSQRQMEAYRMWSDPLPGSSALSATAHAPTQSKI